MDWEDRPRNVTPSVNQAPARGVIENRVQAAVWRFVMKNGSSRPTAGEVAVGQEACAEVIFLGLSPWSRVEPAQSQKQIAPNGARASPEFRKHVRRICPGRSRVDSRRLIYVYMWYGHSTDVRIITKILQRCADSLRRLKHTVIVDCDHN